MNAFYDTLRILVELLIFSCQSDFKIGKTLSFGRVAVLELVFSEDLTILD